MTYIDYLNQFHRWRENGNPGDKLIVLYLNLLDTFNRRGWPEWAGVTTQQLMVLANTENKKSALTARDGLVRAGFLAYHKGHKGKASAYKLLKLRCESAPESGAENENGCESVPESDTESDTENATESGAKNATPNKTKTKTGTKTKNGGEGGDPVAAPASPVRKKYGQFRHVPLSEQELNDLREKLGDEEARRCIVYVDEYVEIHGNRNGWKNFYLVCLKCSRERWGIRANGNGNAKVNAQSAGERPKTLRERMEEEMRNAKGGGAYDGF